MSARAATRAAILKGIACPKLDIAKGEGYVYFIYDDEPAGLFDTHSVMVPRFNELSLEAWIEEGRAFVARMEGERA